MGRADPQAATAPEGVVGLSRLKLNPDFDVWTDPTFHVRAEADLVVGGALSDPSSIYGTSIAYKSPGRRTLQVDALVYSRRHKWLRGYEIKRGAGLHDSGKRRSMLTDLLCIHVLLKSYGELRGLDVVDVHAYIVHYYGLRSIKPPFSLDRFELDAHFGFPVMNAVEEVNDYFKNQLLELLAP
jgi:hypothetical protein